MVPSPPGTCTLPDVFWDVCHGLKREFPQVLAQGVDVLRGVEWPGADANRAVGKGALRAVDVGAQCRPGRMAMSNASSRMPPSSDAGKLRCGSSACRRAATCRDGPRRGSRHLLEPLPERSVKADLVRWILSSRRSCNEFDAGGQAGDAEDVGRPPFEEVRQFARLRLARRIAAGAAFAPDADLRVAVRRTAPRCRSAPAATCGRERRAGRCASPECRWVSRRRVCAASTRNRRSCSRAMRPMAVDRLDGADDVAGMRLGDQPRPAA